VVEPFGGERRITGSGEDADMTTTRRCPYCAEEILAEAIRCRYCRSRLVMLDPAHWYRNHGERRLAGVAIAVARALALPVGAVRIAFVALLFFHLLGPLLYAALWILIPYDPGDESLLEHALARARQMVARLRGVHVPENAETSASGPKRASDTGDAPVPGGGR
jgi:phage shock protein PspC (stress-responsive transcriptional regulator)